MHVIKTSKVEKVSNNCWNRDECEFPAECMNDLVEHMHEFHPLENQQLGFECKYCGENFQTKGILMK